MPTSILIELERVKIVSGNDGLDIEGGNSTVEGLAIGSFSNAIHLESNGNDLVTGNFLGTDTTGENSVGNSLGVLIDNVAGNTIGGLTPAALNVVSGNNEGIQINGSNATSNLIAGNYIGTDAIGTNRLPNGMGLEFVNNSWGNTVGGVQAGAGNLVSGNNGDAIKIDGGSYANVIQGNLVGTDVTDSTALVNDGKGVDINGDDNTIGGTTPGSGNVLSGNSSNGIVLVFSSASGNLMEGNSIGTNLAGTIPIPNQSDGIQLFFSASDNTIGGTASGAGNIIADNQGDGVTVGLSPGDQCVGDTILSNSIFGNSQIGIDLGNDGVTLNTPGSPHTGANNLQSFPVLNEAVAFTGASTVIVGSLNSSPSETFTLQFFSNPTADPSGYGQGETLLGTTTVSTDANGNASFQVSFPVVVTAGYAISATATDSTGDTSEFAQDVTVIAAAPPIAALNDNYNTDINTTLTVVAPGVQGNDVAADGGSFTSILVSSPTHGTLAFNSNGSFTYVPKKGYTGWDSFTYKDDQSGQFSNVATVTISVNPKTLYVTNTNPTGPSSLFQALSIAATSNSPGADSVLFDIPGSGPFQISLTQALPAVTHTTIINGYSQPGAHTNSSSIGDDAVIEIHINGASLPSGVNGLVLSSSGSTVEGLSLTNFNNDAIVVQGPGSNSIDGNFVGVAPAGSGNGSGNQVGICITGSLGNTIGGTLADRNVISDSNQQGVLLENGASDNKIVGNYIGTDASGVNRFSNGTGIALYDSPNNTIGGTASQAANVISGNNNDGILVSSANNGPGSIGTVILGNFIGIDATGSIGVGNGNNGVHIVYGAGTVVGGVTASSRNIISGNQAGVYLENSATGVLIEGNYIGTDVRGFKAIGNQFDGVLLSGTLNTVGGMSAKAANVISGNDRNGVSDGSYAGSIGQNLIEGNLIGTDSSGTVAIPNGQNGVDINTVGDTIGGTAAGAGNVISGNDQYGIRLSGSASENVVKGNEIGTGKNGTGALGNSQDGIHIQDNASDNTVGGTVSAAGNIIEFNGGAGIAVGDSAQFNPILTNSIYSNGDLGINLTGNGNENLQPPVLASAVSKSKKTTIVGSLTGFAANSVYLIQFFSNKTADPSGFGEGQTYLGSLQVTTNGNGAASFQAVFDVSVSAGQFISATATDPTNDTSGFAADVTVTSSASGSSSAAITSAAVVVDAIASKSVLGTLSPASINQSDPIITDLAIDQIQAKRPADVAGSRRTEEREDHQSERYRPIRSLLSETCRAKLIPLQRFITITVGRFNGSVTDRSRPSRIRENAWAITPIFMDMMMYKVPGGPGLTACRHVAGRIFT